MLKLVSTEPWQSATFVGTRNTYKGVTTPLEEIEDLPLVHSFVAEVWQNPPDETVIVILSLKPDPDTVEKGVNELTRKLS